MVCGVDVVIRRNHWWSGGVGEMEREMKWEREKGERKNKKRAKKEKEFGGVERVMELLCRFS